MAARQFALKSSVCLVSKVLLGNDCCAKFNC